MHRRRNWGAGERGGPADKPLMIRATTIQRKHYKIMLLASFPKHVNKVSTELPF